MLKKIQLKAFMAFNKVFSPLVGFWLAGNPSAQSRYRVAMMKIFIRITE